jgi:hypothetical protein
VLPGLPLLLLIAAGSAPAVNMGLEAAPRRSGLDRTIRSINLSAYVTRTYGLAPICTPPRRVQSMNIRYADLDGDNAEEAVLEAVTCKSTDGSPDVSGVFSYQAPDSVRELPIEASAESDRTLFKGGAGRVHLEMVGGRVVRWSALDAGRCPSGEPAPQGRRTAVYRWSGKAFVVDRVDDTKPARGC